VLLTVEDLHAHYGKSHILHGVSLGVDAGEIVCLLGRNGVGKSTTLKSVMGLVTPSRGRVVWKGAPIAGLPPYRIAQLGLGYVPEERRIFPTITVRENLVMGIKGGSRNGGWTPERVYEFFPRLKERERQRAGTLSGGEQQMVALARGLMSRPRLLLIDEPFLGLAPTIVEQLTRVIRRINEDGVTILFIEQNVELALGIASRGYILESGRTILDGPSPQLLHSAEVRRIFLGG
jgi:branched-chain amino acid transport system ATP-binding protein